MFDAELRERLQILRRIGERGLKLAQGGVAVDWEDAMNPETLVHKQYLDLWQHLLDELKRVGAHE